MNVRIGIGGGKGAGVHRLSARWSCRNRRNWAPGTPLLSLAHMRTRLVLLLLLASSACVKNPVTGKRQLSLIGREQEIQLGQEAKGDIAQQIGLVENPELQQYVSNIGMALAKKSERPELPWSFQVLDDPTVNAFALPGGPIFVTRGLLTHLTNEAQLAIVLGHEIGHVTAKHAVSLISKQQLAQLGLGIGTILLPEDLRGLGQVASAGTGLLFLKYGRDAERQSDELAFKYALGGGYDVREMSSVFQTLGAVGGGEGRLPEWLSTHPDPENRVARSQELLAQTKANYEQLQKDRAQYLDRLEGTVFGENPRNGFFEGNTFLHPELTFQMAFPQGWKAVNQATAVTGVSPRQDAAIQLAVTAEPSPEAAAKKFFAIPGVRQGELAAGQLNAQPTVAGYFLAETEQGPLAGLVAFISHQGRTFQIIGYTAAQSLSAYDAALRAAVSSFGPLTDPRVLAVQPARVQIFTLDQEMTLAEAHAKFATGLPLELFALINGFNAQERVPAGTKMKRVVGSPAPAAMR